MSNGLHADFVRQFSTELRVHVENLVTQDRSGVTVLFGPSGAGKTTTLRCIAGLDKPDEGIISFGEEVWSDADRAQFTSPQKRRVGFVPQDFGLFPHLTVERNIGYGLVGISGEARRTRVGEMIEWLDLGGLQSRLPGELSGGQQQRVALARAVAARPRLLLLDEPLASLDMPNRIRLRSELRQLLKQTGIPALLVTHDRDEALALGDEIVVMDNGRVLQQGPVQDVFNRPATSEVAGIVGVETVQPARVVEIGPELVTLTIESTRLFALNIDLPGTLREAYACIRAEDVILMTGEPSQSSPRNSLSAVVKGLSPHGSTIRIALDCGFPLMAALTKQACEEMGLKEGVKVRAMIKAPNVHLIPR
jgi:molybdate transport system ATP-binding protein